MRPEVFQPIWADMTKHVPRDGCHGVSLKEHPSVIVDWDTLFPSILSRPGTSFPRMKLPQLFASLAMAVPELHSKSRPQPTLRCETIAGAWPPLSSIRTPDRKRRLLVLPETGYRLAVEASS